MKVAIVQPYTFPYIGYFQLINAVDVFVFYDDVHFIKKGWINRNNLLVNGNANLFSIPLVKPSQNKLINEIEMSLDDKWISAFFKKLAHGYSKAPYYKEIEVLVHQVFQNENKRISQLAMNSVIDVSAYLSLDTEFKTSSIDFSESRGMNRADRLVEITKQLGGNEYINPIGGVELYKKDYFKVESINLGFIQCDLSEYPQNNNPFLGGLSIIDVLMFNSPEEVRQLLQKYSII